jgi:predicted amidophosphoribosyltransferase
MNLERRSRLQNVKGAFEIRKEIDVRHAAVLDDVVTTGATVSELAALLKKRGVEKVDIWALARTP